MKIMTINVPELYLDAIENMVNTGLYPSRSETFREAIRRFLNKEPTVLNELKSDTFKAYMKKITGM